MTFTTTALAVAALLFGAEPTHQASPPNPLVGNWKALTALSAEGEATLYCSWHISGGGVRETYRNQETFLDVQVDASHTPGWIDITPHYGENVGVRHPGIYRVEGDQLIICSVRMDEPHAGALTRPQSFDISGHRDWIRFVLKKRP